MLWETNRLERAPGFEGASGRAVTDRAVPLAALAYTSRGRRMLWVPGQESS